MEWGERPRGLMSELGRRRFASQGQGGGQRESGILIPWIRREGRTEDLGSAGCYSSFTGRSYRQSPLAVCTVLLALLAPSGPAAPARSGRQKPCNRLFTTAADAYQLPSAGRAERGRDSCFRRWQCKSLLLSCLYSDSDAIINDQSQLHPSTLHTLQASCNSQRTRSGKHPA